MSRTGASILNIDSFRIPGGNKWSRDFNKGNVSRAARIVAGPEQVPTPNHQSPHEADGGMGEGNRECGNQSSSKSPRKTSVLSLGGTARRIDCPLAVSCLLFTILRHQELRPLTQPPEARDFLCWSLAATGQICIHLALTCHLL